MQALSEPGTFTFDFRSGTRGDCGWSLQCQLRKLPRPRIRDAATAIQGVQITEEHREVLRRHKLDYEVQRYTIQQQQTYDIWTRHISAMSSIQGTVVVTRYALQQQLETLTKLTINSDILGYEGERPPGMGVCIGPAQSRYFVIWKEQHRNVEPKVERPTQQNLVGEKVDDIRAPVSGLLIEALINGCLYVWVACRLTPWGQRLAQNLCPLSVFSPRPLGEFTGESYCLVVLLKKRQETGQRYALPHAIRYCLEMCSGYF